MTESLSTGQVRSQSGQTRISQWRVRVRVRRRLPALLFPKIMGATAEKLLRERNLRIVPETSHSAWKTRPLSFSSERSNLENAYHVDAIFSYSVHELFQRGTVAAAFMNVKKIERFAARKNSRNLTQNHNGRIYTGRHEIAEALSSLGFYKFCETSPTDVHWSVCHLAPSPYVQLLCHGNLSDAGQQRVSFEQSFLLVKADASDSRDASDAWPLVVVSHLLTIRDTSLILKV